VAERKRNLWKLLTALAFETPLSLWITFLLVFIVLSLGPTTSSLARYNNLTPVRQFGVNASATITDKYYAHPFDYIDYEFLAPTNPGGSDAQTNAGKALREGTKATGEPSYDAHDIGSKIILYHGVSKIDEPSYDALAIGSKIKIRYAAGNPNISLLNSDPALTDKDFAKSQVIGWLISEALVLLVTAFLSPIAWVISLKLLDRFTKRSGGGQPIVR
jgi:hypothetical protein